MGKEERDSLQQPNLKYLTPVSEVLESLCRQRRMCELQGPEFMMVLDFLNEEAPGHFKRLEGSQAGHYGPVLFCHVLDLRSTHPQAFLASTMSYAEAILNSRS